MKIEEYFNEGTPFKSMKLALQQGDVISTRNRKYMKTAVDWLIEQLTPSISLQQKHIDEFKEKAKEMEQRQFDKMTETFIKNRDQTKWSATQIGFAKGFDYALKGIEDYYEKLEKTQEADEYFTRDYLQEKCDEICNIKYPS
jgi:hypothetical protein